MMDMRKLKKLVTLLVSVMYVTGLFLLYDITGEAELPSSDLGFHQELLSMWPQLNFSTMNLQTWLQLTSQYFHKAQNIDSQPYVLQTATCTIPNYNPMDRSLWDVIRPATRVSCEEEYKPQLTSVKRVDGKHVLQVESSPEVLAHYVSAGTSLYCCYSIVHRINTPAGSQYDSQADNRYSISTCKYFEWETTLEPEAEFIYVKCFSSVLLFFEVEKYSAMHAIVPAKPEVAKRLEKYQKLAGVKYDVAPRPNVIMLGIDSCSRLNLLRTMPRTLSLRKDDGWFELRSYIKVGANTLPNFMALLAGLRGKDSFGDCMLQPYSKMDDCPFLWREFAQSGYATALAEDEPYLGSFNHEKTGFVSQPTDHYLRPFMLSAHDNLPLKMKKGILTVCLGHVRTTEYILKYLEDFTTTYSGRPFFGIFWLNNFSHENPNDVAAEDSRFLRFFNEAHRRGMFNSSIVLFFSDHGTRFGPIRETSIGWFEDRMPFAHLWLPQWFRKRHPEMVKNLKKNTGRLTSPFDLHATFQDVLRIQCPATNTGRTIDGHSFGVSLFREVPENRTCADAGVDEEWCTCVRYDELSPEDSIGVKVAEIAIGHVQRLIDEKSGGLCARLSLARVKKLGWRKESEKGDFAEYVVEFETVPGYGLFEATVRREHQVLSLKGDVNRVNRYGSQSSCIHDLALKEFCYCL